MILAVSFVVTRGMKRSWRLFNVPSLKGATLDPGWLRPVTAGLVASAVVLGEAARSRSPLRARQAPRSSTWHWEGGVEGPSALGTGHLPLGASPPLYDPLP